MDILVLQLVFIASTFLGTLVFCAVPMLVLRRGGRRPLLGSGPQRAMSYMSCVAGGVFVAMAFLGLLPQARAKFAIVLRDTRLRTEFPAAECVVVLGFFFLLTVERLGALCRRRHHHHHSAALVDDLELQSSDPDASRQLLDAADELDAAADQDVLYELHPGHGNPAGGKASTAHNGNPSAGACEGHAHLADLVGQKMGLGFMTLVLALSIHAVFEGLALGLQTDASKALRLFVAILLHECLCALALGVNTAKRRLTVCAGLGYAVLFCAALPFGIGVGIALGQTPGMVGNAVSGVLQALAAGLFVHVTFVEIVPAELGSARGAEGLLKVLFLFIGFLIVAAVNLAQDVQRFFFL